MLWLYVSRYKAVVKPLSVSPQCHPEDLCQSWLHLDRVYDHCSTGGHIFSNAYTFQDPDKNVTFKACASYPVSERLLQEIHSLCFLVFYIIPLSIISVYYSLIARTLYKSTLEHTYWGTKACPQAGMYSSGLMHVFRRKCLILYLWTINIIAVSYFAMIMGPGVCQTQGFNSIPAEQSWASYLTSLSLTFLMYKMKMRTGWYIWNA